MHRIPSLSSGPKKSRVSLLCTKLTRWCKACCCCGARKVKTDDPVCDDPVDDAPTPDELVRTDADAHRGIAYWRNELDIAKREMAAVGSKFQKDYWDHTVGHNGVTPSGMAYATLPPSYNDMGGSAARVAKAEQMLMNMGALNIYKNDDVRRSMMARDSPV